MKKRIRYDDLYKILMLAGVLLVLAYFAVFIYQHFDDLWNFITSGIDFANMTDHLKTKSIPNFIILMLLTSVTAAIPFLSNAFFAVFNGLVYGPVIGFAMNLTSNIMGNYLCIRLLEKFDFSDRETKLKTKMSELDRFKNLNIALIFSYMLPIMPTLLVNYTVVDKKIPLKRWLICLALGVLPSSLMYALGGDAIIAGNFKRIAILLGIVVIVGIGYYMFKKRKN